VPRFKVMAKKELHSHDSLIVHWGNRV